MDIINIPNDLGRRILDNIDSFKSTEHQLKRLNRKVDRILGIEQQEAIDLSALTAQVQAEATLDASVKALVEGIAEMVASEPKLQALADKLKQSGDVLITAVKQNI